MLDIETRMHYCDGIGTLRNRVRRDGVYFFYMSPYSSQLNTLDWLFPRLKENVARQQYESIEELREAIEVSLSEITTELIQASERETD
jgi:transposase